jgi:hypothetical protein
MASQSWDTGNGWCNMGWEKRGNHRYYYHRMRVNGRMKSVYLGRGEAAEQVAARVEETAQFTRSLKELERQEAEALDRLDREVDAVREAIRFVTHQALLETGHHQHKGQWRRRRNDKP